MSESTLPAELQAEVRAYIWDILVIGFDPLEGLAIEAASHFSIKAESGIDELEFDDFVEAEIPKAIERLKLEQQSWPAITDWDRLVAAFIDLEKSGILSRHDYLCCSRCGSSALGEEMHTAHDNGYAVRGGVFYHSQDTKRAAAGEGLYLNFDAITAEPEDMVSIGRETVSALEAQGLRVDWDGTYGTRILVTMNWQRRYPRTNPKWTLEHLPWQLADDGGEPLEPMPFEEPGGRNPLYRPPRKFGGH